MPDPDPLAGIRSLLAADGYMIEIADGSAPGRTGVVISATPEACADCLAPGAVLAHIVGEALGVPAESIDLTYPDAPGEGGAGAPPGGDGAPTGRGEPPGGAGEPPSRGAPPGRGAP